jgi:hypothetical protein
MHIEFSVGKFEWKSTKNHWLPHVSTIAAFEYSLVYVHIHTKEAVLIFVWCAKRLRPISPFVSYFFTIYTSLFITKTYYHLL